MSIFRSLLMVALVAPLALVTCVEEPDGGDNTTTTTTTTTTPDSTIDPDTQAPGPVTNFVATAGDTQVTLTWTNPTDDDLAGVLIRRAEGATAPATRTDGDNVCNPCTSGLVDMGLTNDTTYSYSAFTYDEVPNDSAPVSASATPMGVPGVVNLVINEIDTVQGNNGDYIELYNTGTTAIDLATDEVVLVIVAQGGVDNEVVAAYDLTGTVPATNGLFTLGATAGTSDDVVVDSSVIDLAGGLAGEGTVLLYAGRQAADFAVGTDLETNVDEDGLLDAVAFVANNAGGGVARAQAMVDAYTVLNSVLFESEIDETQATLARIPDGGPWMPNGATTPGLPNILIGDLGAVTFDMQAPAGTVAWGFVLSFGNSIDEGVTAVDDTSIVCDTCLVVDVTPVDAGIGDYFVSVGGLSDGAPAVISTVGLVRNDGFSVNGDVEITVTPGGATTGPVIFQNPYSPTPLALATNATNHTQTIMFSQPLNVATLDAANFDVTDGGGGAVTGVTISSVAEASNGQNWAFNVTFENLPLNETLTVTATTAITNVGGIGLDLTAPPAWPSFTVVTDGPCTPSGATATDLMISEYGERAQEKYLEIFNGTGAAVDLSEYRLERYTNGSGTVTDSFQLGGSLGNNMTWVVCGTSGTFDATLAANCNETDGVINHNGDDAMALAFSAGGAGPWVVADVVGEIGVDPGTSWDVCGGTDLTRDVVLERLDTVTSPNADWTVSSAAGTCEWSVAVAPTVADMVAAATLGEHCI